MRTRQLTWGTAIALLIMVLEVESGIGGPVRPARAFEDRLPQCQAWTGPPEFRVSPAFSMDNTIFAVSGKPIGAGFTYGLPKSTDGGLSWNGLAVPWSTLGNVALSPDYGRDHSLYMLVSATVLGRSTDGGQSWVSTSRPQVDISVPSLAVADASTLFLGLGGGPPYLYPQQGLFYSGDGGATWERIYVGGVRDVALSPNYSQDHTVLIGIAGYHWNGGILKSTDSGRTWQPSREGIEWGSDGVTRDITFSPGYAEDHTVFCLSWEALHKSTDAGAHWVRLAKELVDYPDPPPFGSIWQFVVSPRYAVDQTLWLWGDHEGRGVSTDGGTTWRRLPYPVNPMAAGEYCLPGGGCSVELFGYYWDGSNDYVYKSFDSGQTWHCLESDVTPVTPTSEPPVPEIPEAATWLLLAEGLVGLVGYLWWKRRGRDA